MIAKVIRMARIYKNQFLYPEGKKKTFRLGPVILNVDQLDEGGRMYNSRKSYEEIASFLYPLVRKYNNPSVFLDIGANYGFISIIAAKAFDNPTVILVEPGKKLGKYIEMNLAANGVTKFIYRRAVCGIEEKKEVSFSINPFSSQDNRVVPQKKYWKQEATEMVSVNQLLREIDQNQGVFIKIDVQGFEEHVFKGGELFFNTNRNWLVKSEFAPKWLKSQGTDPEELLRYLVDKYEVAEMPARISYHTQSIEELFTSSLTPAQIPNFLVYILSLDDDNKGWTDLIIRPRK